MLRMIIAVGLCVLGAYLPMHGEEPTATTGPSVRLILAPKQLTSCTGFALMGEIGQKTARVNATLGYQIGSSQRLKLSVEQLTQKLTYEYVNGKTEAWVRQIAGGAGYKYLLDDYYVDSFDLGGWYSNAPNKTLSPFVITTGTTSQSFERYVAGSQAWHGYAGMTVFPGNVQLSEWQRFMIMSTTAGKLEKINPSQELALPSISISACLNN